MMRKLGDNNFKTCYHEENGKNVTRLIMGKDSLYLYN